MTSFLEFIGNYYFIFIIIALVSIFAIIGYLIENKHPELAIKEEKIELNKLDETETLKAEIKDKNLTLNNYMNHQTKETEPTNPPLKQEETFIQNAINESAPVESLDIQTFK